jgi:hypothetical protein
MVGICVNCALRVEQESVKIFTVPKAAEGIRFFLNVILKRKEVFYQIMLIVIGVSCVARGWCRAQRSRCDNPFAVHR